MRSANVIGQYFTRKVSFLMGKFLNGRNCTIFATEKPVWLDRNFFRMYSLLDDWLKSDCWCIDVCFRVEGK